MRFKLIRVGQSLSWVSNCIPRTAAKRAASIAFVNMISNLGNLSGSYLYPPGDGPRYAMACSVQAASAFAAVFVTFGMRWYLVRQNVKMDAQQGVDEGEEVAEENKFRYVV